MRFCLRSSRKCKSENGDYCQPSWDYPNPKRNVAFHQITFILFSLKAKSEWVTFEKRVETFYTQQRTTFIISNGKITKVFDCYCSICLIVSVTFNILKMGYHRFFHFLVNLNYTLKVYVHVEYKQCNLTMYYRYITGQIFCKPFKHKLSKFLLPDRQTLR